MKQMPQWVIARMTEAYGRKYQSSFHADLEACVHAALQEFLLIIEERAGQGWQITGCDGADGFTRDLSDLLEAERDKP